MKKKIIANLIVIKKLQDRERWREYDKKYYYKFLFNKKIQERERERQRERDRDR
jgi:hypothetical protein